LPENKQANVRETFFKQQSLVNNDVIPGIMKSINTNIFPITDGIIYDIIHSLHRHRREEYLKKNRSSPERKIQENRKHSNSRRYEVHLYNIRFNINHTHLLSNTEKVKEREND
jgi:hypothetical protein